MDVLSLATWIVSSASLLYFLYWYGSRNFDYFSKQGIPGPKPLPFIGNLWGTWKQNMPNYDRGLAKQFGRTFGQFDGARPNLWTTDVDLIKSVFIKDFDHFVNRRVFGFSSKFVRKMVIFIQDQEWKDVRSSITPAFTTGKIKKMSGMMTECADQWVERFQHLAETEGKFDAKEQFRAFTIDVIARCVFGMKIDSLGDTNDPFTKYAKQVFNPPVNKSPLVLMPLLLPRLMSLVGDWAFMSEGIKFYIDTLQDLVNQRLHSSQKYHDFVEVAIETISEYTKEIDGKQVPMWNKEEVDEIVIAQSMLFLLAGFDTTATTLTNAVFLLARNSEIQEKLNSEIMKKLENSEEINHEMILDFPYLDHVVKEVLRMYPAGTRVERCCNKEVNYNGITIKKDVVVTVSLFALHYDEEYYPEPNSFNPDRWNANSPIKPNPNAYMPFGMGPRNCIGMRFALEEIKIALCTLVKNFRFFPVAETPMEMQFEDGFLTVVQPIRATVGIELRPLPQDI